MNPFKSYYRWAVRRLEWKYRLERKILRKMFRNKSVQKLAAPPQLRRINGPQLDISIWYRPLKGVRLFTKSISHWCVQVGNDYYELALDEKSRPIKPKPHSQNPFNASQRKKISKTTYTYLSAKEIEVQAQKLFDQEFPNYSLGMEDCQQFCLRLLEQICPDDNDFKNIRTDIYSKSAGFKMAYSSNIPTH